MEENLKSIYDPIPIEAQKRLVEIMNDSPSLVSLMGTKWEIRALKPAVMWKICEEAANIEIRENNSQEDIIKALAANIPAVARIVAYALLNDRKRIEEEFEATYNLLLWETDCTDWATLLREIYALCDVSVFFYTIESVKMFRQMTLERKTTMDEQKQLLQEQSGVK